MRQAHSTNAARTRGLPRLVTLPGTRLLPLLRSPGTEPGVGTDGAAIVEPTPVADLAREHGCS